MRLNIQRRTLAYIGLPNRLEDMWINDTNKVGPTNSKNHSFYGILLAQMLNLPVRVASCVPVHAYVNQVITV